MRRRFLGSLGAAALGQGLGMLGAGPASAQAADYRALVCVFLYGGNDGLNTIVAADDAGYARYAAVRKGLALTRCRPGRAERDACFCIRRSRRSSRCGMQESWDWCSTSVRWRSR